MQGTVTPTFREKVVKLKNQQPVLIRDMLPGDVDRSFDFFASLPAIDRRYLRRDVTRREVVERRIKTMKDGRVVRLVAVANLEIWGHGWGDGVAEIRLIIAKPFQRVGLGMLMARELFLLAAEKQVERIVVRMLKPQEAAINIFRKLGFRDEFTLPEHVRDRDGQWQDMIIMRCNLDDLWHDMEVLVEFSDFPRHW